MKRRAFIRLLGLSAVFHHWLLKDLFAAGGPVVAVAEGKDHARLVREAIAALGGMERFVKKGDVVVVKPNMGWDRTPEQAANTNPMVVRAVVEEALRVGAKKVKVFDRTCNDERRCYANCGIPAALKGMKNVEVKYMDSGRYRKVPINGKVLGEWELYDEVLKADVFINVPVAKHHGLTKLTLGLKNVMGVMGGNRGSIHKNIDGALADVNSVVKSHLVVIDAMPAFRQQRARVPLPPPAACFGQHLLPVLGHFLDGRARGPRLLVPRPPDQQVQQDRRQVYALLG